MNNTSPNSKNSAVSLSGGRHPARRLIGPVIALLVLVAVGNWLGGRWPAMEAAIAEMGSWGYAAYLGAFVFLVPLCFPVSVLGISAGFLFGPWLGYGIHFVAVMLGGIVMFGLGRGLLRGRIKSLLATKPRLAAVDRMVGERAVRLNLLARLSPLNYALVCYTLASGRSSFGAYAVGLLASAPAMAAQIWIGVVARQTGQMGAGTQESSPLRIALLVGGLVFFGLLTWQVGRMVQTAWRDLESGATAPNGQQEEDPGDR